MYWTGAQKGKAKLAPVKKGAGGSGHVAHRVVGIGHRRHPDGEIRDLSFEGERGFQSWTWQWRRGRKVSSGTTTLAKETTSSNDRPHGKGETVSGKSKQRTDSAPPAYWLLNESCAPSGEPKKQRVGREDGAKGLAHARRIPRLALDSLPKERDLVSIALRSRDLRLSLVRRRGGCRVGEHAFYPSNVSKWGSL